MRKYLISMGILAALEIGLALYLTFWRDHFWSTVSARDGSQFIYQLIIFLFVALLICVISATSSYCGSLAAIKWREQLNYKAVAVRDSRIENTNQRIQQDCADYPTLVIQVIFGSCKALIYIIVFSIALAIEFSALYLLYIIAYSLISTLIAKRIARPLITLNYDTQQAEATYRNNLSGINFNSCIVIMFNIAKRTKQLNYFQTFYQQLGVVLPLIIIAPSYFAGLITFGALMKANSTMGTVLDNMSYGILAFNDINKLLSCRKRLNELGVL